jgi:hypothetical protein
MSVEDLLSYKSELKACRSQLEQVQKCSMLRTLRSLRVTFPRETYASFDHSGHTGGTASSALPVHRSILLVSSDLISENACAWYTPPH